MTFTLLKSVGQAFCRMPPNLGLSVVFSRLDWVYGFGRKPQRWGGLLVPSCWGHMPPPRLSLVRWTLTSPWPQWCLPGSSTIKLPPPPSHTLLSGIGSLCSLHSRRGQLKLRRECLGFIWSSSVGRFVSPPPFIYLLSHLFIQVWTHGYLF